MSKSEPKAESLEEKEASSEVVRSTGQNARHLNQSDRKDAAQLQTFFLPKMSILQCQNLAKDIGYDSATFDLVGPKGRFECSWLDAYFGLFSIKGRNGVVAVSSLQYATDLHCENLRAPSVGAEPEFDNASGVSPK